MQAGEEGKGEEEEGGGGRGGRGRRQLEGETLAHLTPTMSYCLVEDWV